MNFRSPLLLILALALLLRLAYALSLDPQAPYDDRGGDSGWYLANAYALVTGENRSQISVDVSRLPTAPVYLLFIGFWQAVLSPEAAVLMIRILQAVMGAATCYFIYRLAAALGGERAGLVAAGVLAISPAFVIESAQVLTETLYLFLVAAGMWVYSLHENIGTRRQSLLLLALAGLILGAVTLTRAVLLLFPPGLALHLLMAGGRRRGLLRAAVLLTVYALTVSTWTIYNKARWDRWVVGAEGMIAFLYVGAREQGWDGPNQIDTSLLGEITDEAIANGEVRMTQEDYAAGAAAVISSDPAGYIRRRLAEAAGAQIQPHGTAFFPGESLKDLLTDWLRDDRTPGGLLRVMNGEAFWPKLVIYLFHYTGIVAGLVGMWLSRRDWRASLPLAGFILYTGLIHLVLTALPRYIFPTQLFWWVFAGVALARLLQVITRLSNPGQHRSGRPQTAIEQNVGVAEDVARVEGRRQ